VFFFFFFSRIVFVLYELCYLVCLGSALSLISKMKKQQVSIVFLLLIRQPWELMG